MHMYYELNKIIYLLNLSILFSPRIIPSQSAWSINFKYQILKGERERLFVSVCQRERNRMRVNVRVSVCMNERVRDKKNTKSVCAREREKEIERIERVCVRARERQTCYVISGI
jgi:hypothetical protein